MENETPNVQVEQTNTEVKPDTALINGIEPKDEVSDVPTEQEQSEEIDEQEQKPYIDDDGNLIKPEPKKEQEVPETKKTQEENIEKSTDSNFPDRELLEVEQLYNRTVEDGVNEFKTLRDNYLKKAGKPIVTITDPNTGREQQYYADYTAEEAFQYGIETGDYDPFLTSLSPLEVRNFLKDKQALDTKYDTELNNLGKEKEYKKLAKEKEADVVKWDEYIKPFKEDSPKIAYMLEKFKIEAGFDKNIADKLVQWLKEAEAVEINKKTIQNETDKMKKAMMGHNPQIAPQTKNYKNIPLKDIPDDEYLANEAEIIRQKLGKRK